MSERQLQKQVFDFLSISLPWDAFYTAIPGGDGKVTLTPGYYPGVPDILVVWDGSPFFIELKYKKGRVSDSQVRCHMRLIDSGAKVQVCRSLAEVEAFLSRAGVPLGARVAA